MFYRTSEYTAADAGDTVLAIYAYHEHGCHRLFSALTSTRIPFLYPPPPRLTAPASWICCPDTVLITQSFGTTTTSVALPKP